MFTEKIFILRKDLGKYKKGDVFTDTGAYFSCEGRGLSLISKDLIENLPEIFELRQEDFIMVSELKSELEKIPNDSLSELIVNNLIRGIDALPKHKIK